MFECLVGDERSAVGAVLIARDVTEGKKADESLTRARESGMTPFDNAINQHPILAKLTAAIPGETKVFAIGT